MKNTIVTFSCDNKVHVFEPRCGQLPMFPYKSHETVEKAISYLESFGNTNVQIKTYKTLKP